MNMHPAKALETAVFSLVDAIDNGETTIRNTNITVKHKLGWYWIIENGTKGKPVNRINAINTLKQLLSA